MTKEEAWQMAKPMVVSAAKMGKEYAIKAIDDYVKTTDTSIDNAVWEGLREAVSKFFDEQISHI